MVKKLFNRWCQIDVMKRLIIIAIICAVSFFGVLCAFEDWSVWSTHEAAYVELQEIAYGISENQNLNLKPDENLQNYKIVWNKDGTIDITLHAHDMSYIYFTVNENYQIQEMHRGSEVWWYIIVLIVSFIGAGFFGAEVIFVIYYAIKVMCRFIIKIKNEPAEQKEVEKQENIENTSH